ncbi:conserved hypothetical protein [Pediculus humanus corporis]|uniref:Leptin receptor gene-related protein n=1 Tax=Pediculus humanus subsp. corporis TaxID=121224 RepID=E0V996_PEDHC|nr:uncharacterized protein Phum_PHUM006430 [Pediculus humanus corporis]EEB09952.1 conserved hypothetical protein [Pediculus humanus corporis]
MAGVKSLVGLAFAGSIGMTFLILACALPNSWWPFFVLFFYFLAAVPTAIAQRCISESSGDPSSYMNPAIFLTMGCVVSAFALPIVLARAPQNIITMTACYLTVAGNVVIFLTILGFFMIFQQEESGYY